MALHLHILPTACFSKGLTPYRSVPIKPLSHHCMSLSIRSHVNSPSFDPITERRSANYQPSIWGFDFLQSLKSDYTGEAYKDKTKKLEDEVKHKLDDRAMGHLCQLELIDDIERLGLSYLFEEEIKKALDTIACMKDMDTRTEESLHATALQFRLLRQHGYEISQGVFNHLKDEAGNFIASSLDDVKGVLSLYEASHLAVEGENILDEARDFTRTVLEGIKCDMEPGLAKLVIHALEHPLHWRMHWLEARWYIDIYGEKENSIPALIELAKLNFNIVQAVHQKDLAELSRWWEHLGLGENLGFVRDDMVQRFLWALGMNPEPHLSNFRIELTKVLALITTIDDVYDVYGSLEELELFTDAVERWDIEAVEQLPDYMKICFLALFNTVNEMAYVQLKETGFNSLHFLKKEWVDLCKAYLIEAKWYYNNHRTTLEECLNNAITTISVKVILIHAFFSLRQTFRKEALYCFSQYPSLLTWPSMIVRLANDLGTSKDELERGDVLKSIQSYMHQTGASEDVAREHIRHMIDETWKKLNKEVIISDESLLPQHFIRTTVNLVRISLFIYQYGDGHATIDNESKNQITSLFFEPIPLVVT
ncbi:alpha-terpineol synthase, chloroplastic-like [Macadamia integrifolia]|uniref:alpha-terpineol synthase, chloroplastic-like n=1 Tax=Macadamia integrifolia TaxID=60698 RepID=UPI001C4FE8C5|nr:alpha-terpineol synthase, chloroplastic-like [Macadamia integrifolia]